jgi:Tol biopolymer transport system component
MSQTTFFEEQFIMHRIPAFIRAIFTATLVIMVLAVMCNTTPMRAEQDPPGDFSYYLPITTKPYPKQPTTGLRIAYSSQWTGQLMQYNVDTGAVSQLLPDHLMSEDCWKFSPDKAYPKLLYLLHNVSTGNLDIKIKDFYGANTVVTLPTAYRNTCSNFWHPSASAIAAYNLNTNTYDLLSPNGGKIASFWGDLGWKAAFSPDGNRVVFVSPYRSDVLRFFNIIKDGNGNINGLSQDPSDFVEVDIGDHFIADIEWSPDGSKLAILIENNWDLEDADIIIISPNGTVLSNLTNGFNRQNGKLQNYWDLQWSPSEQKIAFWVYNRVGNTYVNPQVYMIDVNRGQIFELTDGAYPTGETPSFSPDGNKVIFTAGPQYGRTIVMCNPDGTDKIPLPIENSGFGATFRP